MKATVDISGSLPREICIRLIPSTTVEGKVPVKVGLPRFPDQRQVQVDTYLDPPVFVKSA